MGSNSESTKTIFIAFAAGLLVGGVCALLWAPQSGEKTRKMISRRAAESRDYLRHTTDDLKRKADDFADMAKDVRRTGENLLRKYA